MRWSLLQLQNCACASALVEKLETLLFYIDIHPNVDARIFETLYRIRNRVKVEGFGKVVGNTRTNNLHKIMLDFTTVGFCVVMFRIKFFVEFVFLTAFYWSLRRFTMIKFPKATQCRRVLVKFSDELKRLGNGGCSSYKHSGTHIPRMDSSAAVYLATANKLRQRTRVT